MIIGINHITLAVSDLSKSLQFYTEILGCRPVAKWRQGCYLLAGNLWLCLMLDPKTRTSALPEYTHLAFTVAEEDFVHLSHKILASGMEQWKENTSEGLSLYFLDPNGHKLEIHTTNLQARLVAVKQQPYADMIFYDN